MTTPSEENPELPPGPPAGSEQADARPALAGEEKAAGAPGAADGAASGSGEDAPRPEGADAGVPEAEEASSGDEAGARPVDTGTADDDLTTDALAAPQAAAVDVALAGVALDAGAAGPVEKDERELALRLAEAMAFAADRPVPSDRLQPLLPEGFVAREIFAAVAERYAGRGVELVEVAGGWAFRTAPDLAMALTRVIETPRRLPRVAMETLAIIAYHQPVTRAEIEEIRGASLSQNTLDVLLEMGLIAPRGRKEVPGRPSLWATTTRFLEQFGLKALGDLPRREELLAGEGPGLDLRGGG